MNILTLEHGSRSINSKVIVDCDGVLLDWAYAFNVWMLEQGYKKINEDRQIHEGAGNHYKGAGLGDRKDLARGKNWGTKDA